MSMRQAFWAVVTVAAAMMAAGRAQAGLVIDIFQQGTDVVAEAHGTLNITGMSSDGGGSVTSAIIPSEADIAMGPVLGGDVDFYKNVTGPSSFGSGDVAFVSSGSGDAFSVGGSPDVGVPTGFISGGSISSSDTWANSTFSGLGLTPGTYTFNLPNDTITVNIGGAGVPEPSSLVLAGIAAIAGLVARCLDVGVIPNRVTAMS
jgi:hypothetical protein